VHTAARLHSVHGTLAVDQRALLYRVSVPCAKGLNGYALQQCLKQERLARQSASSEDEALSVEEERIRMRQYEQPGTLVTLPSGKS
jgi:hypothetical protein